MNDERRQDESPVPETAVPEGGAGVTRETSRASWEGVP